jgi:hypothetical protein
MYLQKIIFFEKYRKSKMAPILAAILFFKITGMFDMIFNSVIGSGMVENIYLDTKIMTLSSLLRKLEVFSHIFGMPGGHFGGHLVFIDNEYMIFNSFIGSGMTENLYLDTKFFTRGAFLSELE